MLLSKVILVSFVFLAQIPEPPAPPPPKPEPPIATGEPVTDAERGRIEAMLQKYAASKLKGQKIEQTFRKHLIPGDPDVPPEEGGEGAPAVENAEPPANDATAPHEFSFHAQLPDSPDAFKVSLLGAEVLGPKRYRLVVAIEVPFDNLGGHYRFEGAKGFLGTSLGWIVDQVAARVVVTATLDLGWKTLENGNLGLYPGGTLDESLTEEERKSARLFEDLRIDAEKVDLSRVNLEGINRRRVFVQNGVAVGRGGLFRALGPGGRAQIEQMIEGGLSNAIRSNEPQFVDGINQMMQEQLPNTQIQVTSFIEKLAIQANLPGKKIAKPPEPKRANPADGKL